MNPKAPIFLAVDSPDFETASAWVQATHEYIAGFKVGLEFFSALGSEGVRKLMDLTDADIFLDVKLHDIPNTVAAATRALSHLTPKFLTVHASGGQAMIAAAAEAGPQIKIAAVTVLTSLSSDDVKEVGFQKEALPTAVNLAKLAVSAGAHAIVCSPQEISAIRQAVGADISIITPGVRPLTEESKDDQQRTMDPAGALIAGADYLVIGRPITRFWSEGGDAMKERTLEIVSQLK